MTQAFDTTPEIQADRLGFTSWRLCVIWPAMLPAVMSVAAFLFAPCSPLPAFAAVAGSVAASMVYIRQHSRNMSTATARERLLFLDGKKAGTDGVGWKLRLLAASSHDIRQPLQSLMLYINGLAKLVLPEGVGVLASAESVLGDLSKKIDGLLELARLEAGGVKPDIRPAFVDDILGRLATTFSGLAASRKLAFSVQTGISHGWILTDGALLYGVLSNIVDNAVKYTPDGSVTITAEESYGKITISVADTGPGMSRDDQVRAFEEFTQLAHGIREKRPGEGVGLGLAIVKRTSDIIGAGLAVKSLPGRGTTMSVTLETCLPPALAA
jgi:signal transduction histidine kinase